MKQNKHKKTQNILVGVLVLQLILLPLATAQSTEASVSSEVVVSDENNNGLFGKVSVVDNELLDSKEENINLLVGGTFEEGIDPSHSELYTDKIYSKTGNFIEIGDRVGIGTSSPGATLTVADPSSSRISITSGDTTKQNYLNIFTKDDNVNGGWDNNTADPLLGDKGWHITARGDNWGNIDQQNDLMFFKYNGSAPSPWSAVLALDYLTGRMGIGTSSPDNRLHVYDTSSSWNDPVAIFDSGGPNTRISIQGPANTGWHGLQFSDPTTPWKGGFFLDAASNDLRFYTSSDGINPRLVIANATGNVGIGISDPQQKLDVNGSVIIRGDLTCTGATCGGSDLWQENGSDIYYDAGRVGIGTSTFDDRARLQIDSPAGFPSRIILKNANGESFFINTWDSQNKFSIGRTNLVDDIVIDEDGGVGIGTTTLTDNYNTTAKFRVYDANGANYLRVFANGDFFPSGTAIGNPDMILVNTTTTLSSYLNQPGDLWVQADLHVGDDTHIGGDLILSGNGAATRLQVGFDVPAITNVTELPATPGLTDGTTLDIGVTAVYTSGESQMSEVINHVVSADGRVIRVEWSSINHATGYNVWRVDSPTNKYLIYNASASETQYNISTIGTSRTHSPATAPSGGIATAGDITVGGSLVFGKNPFYVKQCDGSIPGGQGDLFIECDPGDLRVACSSYTNDLANTEAAMGSVPVGGAGNERKCRGAARGDGTMWVYAYCYDTNGDFTPSTNETNINYDSECLTS